MQSYGVLVVHGISNQDPTRGPRTLLRNIRTQLKLFDGPFDKIDLVTELAVWWKPLQRLQDAMYQKTSARLAYPKLRRIFMGLLGDAIAYQPTPPSMAGDPNLYQWVHDEMTIAVLSLADRLPPNAPLMVVTHSLGSVVGSNYIWDMRNNLALPRRDRDTPLVRMETIDHLVTMGSPLATYSARFPDGGKPVDVPKWTNFYNSCDVVSSPLSPINQDYRDKVTDVHADLPGLWNWTPASHCAYWGSKQIAHYIAGAIASSMEDKL